MTKSALSTKQISLADNGLALVLFGKRESNIKILEGLFSVKIDTRGSTVNISGATTAVDKAERLIEELYALLAKGYTFTPSDIESAAKILSSKSNTTLSEIFMDTIVISHKKKKIAPRGIAQKNYVDAIRKYDIVFGIGPAGTGKTYLAMASAVRALTEKKVERIILTRPAVEAGEKLGFLPGDLAAKVDPYLRPLYDALHDMMDFDQVQRLLERGVIEVAPLAFMRGRTLNDSFVILDEAQNTTVEQIKMFLTRLGFGSKAVVTGDITQIDLPSERTSGLVATRDILKNIKGIEIVHFTHKDVVRHPLVTEVIKAFERVEER
ncbi:MAG: PhoH family protein [Thermodesulfobacteriota bacterium]